MKLLAFAASLRKESMNKRLLGKAIDIASGLGAEVDHADFREFDMPHYDQDLQEEHGLPPGAEELARRIRAADGIMIASPEYNHSIPGTLKNAIDWMSRIKPDVPLDGASVFLMSASPAMVGGYRGLMQVRIPLDTVGAWVSPKMFALAQAPQAYDDDGNFKDAALAKMFEAMIADFMSAAEALGARAKG